MKIIKKLINVKSVKIYKKIINLMLINNNYQQMLKTKTHQDQIILKNCIKIFLKINNKITSNQKLMNKYNFK